jgi:hypothetical protein
MAEVKMTRFVLVGLAVAFLAACEGGGDNPNVSTVDNPLDNSTNNPDGCAS